MYIVCMHCIVSNLCLSKVKKKKKRERMMNKIETFMFGFLHLVKVA